MVLLSTSEWTLLPAADPGDGSDWQGNYTFYDKNGNSIDNTKQNANKIVYSVYESSFLKGLSSARKEYVKANALKCNNVKGRNACESFFG